MGKYFISQTFCNGGEGFVAGWPTEPHYGWSKRANGASLLSTERGGTSTEHKVGAKHEGRGSHNCLSVKHALFSL